MRKKKKKKKKKKVRAGWSRSLVLGAEKYIKRQRWPCPCPSSQQRSALSRPSSCSYSHHKANHPHIYSHILIPTIMSYQQGYPPQQQGYPPQGYPPQGYPPQGYPPQGYAQPQPVYVQQAPAQEKSDSNGCLKCLLCCCIFELCCDMMD